LSKHVSRCKGHNNSHGKVKIVGFRGILRPSFVTGYRYNDDEDKAEDHGDDLPLVNRLSKLQITQEGLQKRVEGVNYEKHSHGNQDNSISDAKEGYNS
jgi:hypothetical protein